MLFVSESADPNSPSGLELLRSPSEAINEYEYWFAERSHFICDLGGQCYIFRSRKFNHLDIEKTDMMVDFSVVKSLACRLTSHDPDFTERIRGAKTEHELRDVLADYLEKWG